MRKSWSYLHFDIKLRVVELHPDLLARAYAKQRSIIVVYCDIWAWNQL
jgi:hypothetical protein